jgi:hypothetical protein
MGKFSWTRQWKLQGWDTFAGNSYFIGRYFTEAGALRAAKRYLRQLEKTQPTQTSGGQVPGGIQDRVSVIRPDETEYRFP